MNLEAKRFIEKLEKDMPKGGKKIAQMEESREELKESGERKEEPSKSTGLDLEERIGAILERKLDQLLEKRGLEVESEEEDLETNWNSLPKSPVKVDDEPIKNKRSANEATVLMRILDMATFDSGDDLKKTLVEIQLLAKRRLFILELSERVGWGVAAAYAELFPKDVELVPSKLLKASEYFEMLGKVKSKGKRRGTLDIVGNTGRPRGSAGNLGNRNPGSYGECFRCGKKGHWARECPLPKENAKG
ncbi:MAG: C2HC-type zinc finger protein [Vulcanimicrobiaceae bacterium]